MPNLEDCIIQFEDPNPTMTRVENAPSGVGLIKLLIKLKLVRNLMVHSLLYMMMQNKF